MKHVCVGNLGCRRVYKRQTRTPGPPSVAARRAQAGKGTPSATGLELLLITWADMMRWSLVWPAKPGIYELIIFFPDPPAPVLFLKPKAQTRCTNPGPCVVTKHIQIAKTRPEFPTVLVFYGAAPPRHLRKIFSATTWYSSIVARFSSHIYQVPVRSGF